MCILQHPYLANLSLYLHISYFLLYISYDQYFFSCFYLCLSFHLVTTIFEIHIHNAYGVLNLISSLSCLLALYIHDANNVLYFFYNIYSNLICLFIIDASISILIVPCTSFLDFPHVSLYSNI